jgi:hypothetical protein
MLSLSGTMGEFAAAALEGTKSRGDIAGKSVVPVLHKDTIMLAAVQDQPSLPRP